MALAAEKTHEQSVALPTTRWENWKYTSLAPVAEMLQKAPVLTAAQDFAQTSLPALPEGLLDFDGHLVLVDGLFREDLSVLPTEFDVSFETQFEQADTEKPLAVLNGQHAQQAVVISVPADAKIDKPLVIQHYSTGTTNAAPRFVLEAGSNSEAVVVELWQGVGKGVNNISFEVNVAKNAVFHHYRWQDETKEATHLATSDITVDRDASYDSFVLTTGASLARQDSEAHMIGENVECRLNGVYLLADKQHQDTTILIHHKKPHGRSNQSFKGIIDDHARAVFQGKVFVHRDAQKTDGYQLNNALLLSNTAEVDVKPELEIYADDVKCSHGATTGQMDTAPLFYLRTRGLSEAQAKLMLMQAFVGPALEEIRSENVREIFSAMTLEWLQDHVK